MTRSKNLTQITSYIKGLFREDERVHSVIQGDVYNVWNHTNKGDQYISVVIDYETSSYYGDYVDYTFLAYAGNLINGSQTNINSSISVGDSIMQNVLHKIDTEDNGMDLVVPCTTNPFMQQWEDVLAGVWCRITIRTSIDPLCDIEQDPGSDPGSDDTSL